MSPSLFEFNASLNIKYRVKIWTLTRPKHEPDGLLLNILFGCLKIGPEHGLDKKHSLDKDILQYIFLRQEWLFK